MNIDVMDAYLKDWNADEGEKICQQFKYSAGIRDVVKTVKLPMTYGMDTEKFFDKIATVAYFTCGNDFLSANLSYEDIMEAIRYHMENEMQRSNDGSPFTSLLAATIGVWAACEYFDLGVSLNDIRNQSIDAAWTDAYQKMMREQWENMEPVMNQYRGHL